MRQKPFRLSFEIGSDFGYLAFLTRIFKALNVSKAHPLTQILVEAYNNAVLHAHKKNRAKWVGIDLLVEKNKVRIRVIDQGKGFHKNEKKSGPLLKTSGRGLALIVALADKTASHCQYGKHIFEAVKNI